MSYVAHTLRVIGLVSLLMTQGAGGLFAQEPKKVTLPDSLKLEKKDTTHIFLKDTTLQQKWEKGATLEGTLAQVYLKNWVPGGESSVTGVSTVHLFARRLRKTSLWENKLDATLGYVGQGNDLKKTTDRLDLVSNGRIYLKQKWFYAWRVNLRTQMLPGYQSPGDSLIISNFLSPGYMYINFGFDYHPFKNQTLLLAPLSSKVTLVADQELANKGAFGVVQATFDLITSTLLSLGQNLKYEFGGFIRYTYDGKITPTTTLETQLEFFSNYLKKPLNIDVDWELLAKVTVVKGISVNLYTHLIYDDDINMEVDDQGNIIRGPAVQFQEILGLGMTFTFGDKYQKKEN